LEEVEKALGRRLEFDLEEALSDFEEDHLVPLFFQSSACKATKDFISPLLPQWLKKLRAKFLHVAKYGALDEDVEIGFVERNF